MNIKYVNEHGQVAPVEEWLDTLYATTERAVETRDRPAAGIEFLLQAAEILGDSPREDRRPAKKRAIAQTYSSEQRLLCFVHLVAQFKPDKVVPIWLMEGALKLGERVSPPQTRVPHESPEFDGVRDRLLSRQADLVLVSRLQRQGQTICSHNVTQAVEMETRWLNLTGTVVIPAKLTFVNNRYLSGFHLLSVRSYCDSAPPRPLHGDWWLVKA